MFPTPKNIVKRKSRHIQYIAKLAFKIIFILIWSPTQSIAAEGTIGWSYVNNTGVGLQFAPTPMDACSGYRIAGVWSGMISMAPSPVLPGLSYDCLLKPTPSPPVAPPMVMGTGLHCSSGYIGQFPGVCVKRISNVKPPIPPVSPSASMAPLECSASNPGFTMGNPVILVTGIKVQQERDIRANQWGTLEIERTYRYARNPVSAPTAGTLWSFSFERQLVAADTVAGSAPPRISIISGDGSSIGFDKVGLTYKAEISSGDMLYPLTSQHDEWIYKSASGTLEHFKKTKSKYLLVSITRQDGNASHYSYDEHGKLNGISDSFGRTLYVTWQDDYAIASISSPEFSVHYQYDPLQSDDGTIVDGMRRIASVRIDDADGIPQGARQYHYGEGWPAWFYLTGINDENNVRFATYSYDAEGRVSRSEHAGGAQRHDFSYPTDLSRLVIDPWGGTRTITLAPVAGQLRATSFSQPGGAGCGPAASAYTYNAYGMLQSRSDFNNVKTCFTQDTVRHLEMSRIDGIPATAACQTNGIPGTGQRKVSNRWHPDWPIKTMIAEPLKLTHYVYNGQPDIDGTTASCGNGGTLPDGQPIAVLCKKIENATTDKNGGAGLNAIKTGAPRISTYTYNQVGQVLSSTTSGRTGSGGDTTRYEYHTDTTTSHTRGDLAKITSSTGHIREFLEYTYSGLATRIREPNGQFVEMSYDARQRLTRRIVSAAGAAEQTTRYHYDLVGQLTGVDLPDGSHIAYRYDDAHRLTDVRDSRGNTVHYTLDPMGNRVREDVHDATGNLTGQIVRIYDALNRIQSVTEGAL